MQLLFLNLYSDHALTYATNTNGYTTQHIILCEMTGAAQKVKLIQVKRCVGEESTLALKPMDRAIKVNNNVSATPQNEPLSAEKLKKYGSICTALLIYNTSHCEFQSITPISTSATFVAVKD